MQQLLQPPAVIRCALVLSGLTLASALPLESVAAEWCATPNPTALPALRHEVEKNLLPASRAIERVHTEGTLPHQGIWDQSTEARKDWPLMRDLAVLWRAQKRPEDLTALSRLLTDWGKVYTPSFNPIDETDLDSYIDAYIIARDDLPEATRETAQRWIRKLGEGYLDRMEHEFKASDGRWINNWNAHRVKLATLAAAALDDKDLWTRTRAQFAAHLGRNIRADGSTVDFEQRDAMHYVVYDLEPLLRAAQAAHGRGEDWLHMKGSAGAGLAQGLDWLAPYARGEKTHEEFAHTKVRFDLQRRAAGVSGFEGIWDRQLA